MKWIKQQFEKLIGKKSKNEPIETVQIRASSVPDWLYKITIKNPNDSKEKAREKKEVLLKITKEIGFVIDKIELHRIVTQSISKYKLESITTNKNKFTGKVKDIIATYNTKTETLESFRKYFSLCLKEIEEKEASIISTSKKLEEFYKDDCIKIRELLHELKSKTHICKETLELSNDKKVQVIIEKIADVSVLQEIETKLEKEITAYTNEIESLREHVYKLGHKISDIKTSTRFKDVLQKETKLGEQLDDLEKIYATLQKEFETIDTFLFMYAEKNKVQDLAKEYCTHIDLAIEHDKDMQILAILKGLSLDLKNKRTKIRQMLKDEDAEKHITTIAKLLVNFENSLKDISQTKHNIQLSRRSVRKQVILSELEDIESRKTFYQKKLIDLSKIRESKIKEIQNLGIDELKEKISKELLLLTGYEVKILYDEK